MTLDFTAHVAADTARLVEVASGTNLGTAVPSCPDWDLADLVWHLTKVQGFWAEIVAGHLDGPDAVPEQLRAPRDQLVSTLAATSERLVAALRAADPAAHCWTWSHDETVSFVLRRQAHEALIHRVDAELAAGLPSSADPDLAADGVDEILSVFMGGIPEWAEFHASGRSALLVADDVGRSWALEIGRMVGTSPTSGTSYDLDAIDLRDADGIDPTATVSGDAFTLDRWLWGRSGIDALAVAGDDGVVQAVREIAVEVTQ